LEGNGKSTSFKMYLALSGLLNHGHQNNQIKISGSDKQILQVGCLNQDFQN
jgi:hypothetical protein